ncbi:MAG: DUF3592 domain-containing protein [Alphaproteobacteria bacterium]|nr:DUF3592 domain-containing protein [Alphaproteobacteria bacterium]
MDFVFGMFSAFDAIMLFIMGSVFSLIGAAIAGYEIYWRIKSRKVAGRIKSVRSSFASNRRSITESYESYSDDKNNKKSSIAFGVFFTLFSSIFVCIGAYFILDYVDLSRNGYETRGTVVENKSYSDGEGGTNYNAIVEFVDHRNAIHRVRNKISYGSSPSFDVGEVVQIYYDPDDPERFAIADFWHTLTLPIVFAAMGSLFMSIGVAVMIGGSNKEEKTYNKLSNDSHQTNQRYFYPVYEYTLDGVTKEKVGEIGRNFVTFNMPGQRVKLNVLPGDPDKVKRPSLFLLIFGLIFLAPGLFLLSLAVDKIEFGFPAIALVLILFAFIAFKIRKALGSVPFAEIKAGIAEIKKEGFKEKFKITDNLNLAGKAEELAPEEMRAIVQSEITQLKSWTIIFLLISTGLAVGGYYAAEDMITKSSTWERARGEVVRFNQKSSSSDSGTSYSYYSVVRFSSPLDGRSIEFEDSVGSSTRMHDRGDKVNVLFEPNSPQKAIIDRGIFNWGLSVGLWFLSLLLVLSSLKYFSVVRQHGGKRYARRV